jgi:MFS family permease
LSTCIYLAVLVVEYPINWIIPRVPMAKFLSGTIILWGITLGMHAVCHNFAGILVARTVLGALEAVCQPSFIIISGTWYTRSEQSSITIYWLLMAGLQQIIGGLLGYAFSNIPVSSPIKSWQSLYMAYAIVTVLWGTFVFFWMLDSLMRAKCFSEEDKKLMIERVRKNQTGVQNRIFRKEQVWEAFKDPQSKTSLQPSLDLRMLHHKTAD